MPEEEHAHSVSQLGYIVSLVRFSRGESLSSETDAGQLGSYRALKYIRVLF